MHKIIYLKQKIYITEVMQQNRLRWFGHVERRDELCWIKRIETLQVDGDGVKGRPRKRWREVLREDMREGTLLLLLLLLQKIIKAYTNNIANI